MTYPSDPEPDKQKKLKTKMKIYASLVTVKRTTSVDLVVIVTMWDTVAMHLHTHC